MNLPSLCKGRSGWQQTRYVGEETMDVRAEPLCLLLLDAIDTSGEGLFKEMQQYLTKFWIPFGNILALLADNAAVMVGIKNSFFMRLKKAQNELSVTFMQFSCTACVQRCNSKMISWIFYVSYRLCPQQPKAKGWIRIVFWIFAGF